MVSTIANSEENVISGMKMISQVNKIYTTNGRWDLAVEIRAADLESFDTTLTSIRKLDGIEATETNLLLSSRIS